jgi:Na+:H+ antiporter, NhaA family
MKNNKNNGIVQRMNLTKLFKRFYESEKIGGLILVFCTVVSLILANTDVGEGYIQFWESPVLIICH